MDSPFCVYCAVCIEGCDLHRGFVSHFICFMMKRITLQMEFVKCYSWNQTFNFVVGFQGAQHGRDPGPATGSWLVLILKPKSCKG